MRRKPCPDFDFGTVLRIEQFLFSPVVTMKKDRGRQRREEHQMETSKQQVNRIYEAPEIF